MGDDERNEIVVAALDELRRLMHEVSLLKVAIYEIHQRLAGVLPED